MAMECNKEEALRARSIAENKMQSKDFVGAQKVALKAQKLFPELENIAQLLTVCEVHCSAGIKVNGETDWYGILQVEPAADESTIRKQYRKLALLLHPDKNKFAGAEAAFKLVGEAHRTLSDIAKRSLHDMKRSSTIKTVQSQPSSNRTSYASKQPAVPNNLASNTFKFNGLNQQQPPSAFSGAQTFWTICPFCGIRYQYYRSIMNRALRCQNCLKPFIAYDLNAQAAPPGANSEYPWNQSGIPQQGIPGQGAHNAKASSSMGSQGNVGGGSQPEPWSKSGINSELRTGSTNKAKENGKVDKEAGAGNEVKFEKVKLEEVNKREQVVKPSGGNANRKRGRKMVIESSDSDSTGSEDIVIEDGPAGQTDTRYPRRRSTRQKQNVTYNEERSDDDDFVNPPSYKRVRKGGSSCNIEQSGRTFSEEDVIGPEVRRSGAAISKDCKDEKQKRSVPPEDDLPNGNEQVNKCKMNEREQVAVEKDEFFKTGASSEANIGVGSVSKTSPNLNSFSYPDPEFYDFGIDRATSKFAVDQIWAVYDALDGMPRFYVWIRNVYARDFKLRFTWLEHDPIGKVEMEWSEEELPVACGSFKPGKSEYTQDHLMFSHQMVWRKGTRRNSYVIYPRKGEVWALFKGWDIRWSSDPDNHRDYEYEVVEVLSDYTEGTGISVIHLVKVKGYVSLFVQAVDKRPVPLHILPNELLRFSHKVPSYRMTGEEREVILEGSFELDSASLPSNFEETFPSISLDSTKVKIENLDVDRNILHSKSAIYEEKPATLFEKTNTPNTPKKKGIELNGNIQEGNNMSSRNLSHEGVNEAWKHVAREAVTPKEKDIDHRNYAAEDHNASPPASPGPISYEYPDSEFHNFDSQRSSEKFQCGQVWALFSDIDSYPKYYGWIKQVELEDFKVHVTWLEGCPLQDQARWFEEQLPVGCGTFKIVPETTIYSTPDIFSHLIRAEQTAKDQYCIYPHIGEVWALYKNWSVGWKHKDLEDCEYDVVEVLDRTASGMKVFILTKVEGYRAVFKPERKGGVVETMEIPLEEILRFSHQIPAFRLTEERGGKLRGYWELDPASVPEGLLFK